MDSPITVLIVDDEAPARKKLATYLAKDSRFKIVAEAKNGQEAIIIINQYAPQLLLLDIQMPGLTGFDVLRLMDNQDCAVIFTTAYDEYAVDAFEVSATDYLLKPINEDRFFQALDKVIHGLEQDWRAKISTVLHNLKIPGYISRLSVRHGQLTKLLNVSDIKVIRTEHRLVNVIDCKGGCYWTNEKLSDLQRRLDPTLFARVHRSAIINLAAEFDVASHNSGRLKILYQDGMEVMVSREYSSAFKQWLHGDNAFNKSG